MDGAKDRPHDHFFKRVFGDTENARDLLENYLPAEVLERVDLSTLRPGPGSYVDESLKEVLTDLTFEARLVGEENLYVYVLFEHKSYDERYVVLQVLKAMVMIWDGIRKKKTDRTAGPSAEVEPDSEGSGSAHADDDGRREGEGGEDARGNGVGDCEGDGGDGDAECGVGKARKADPLPVVIPFVAYHGERKPRFPRRLRDLFGHGGNLLKYVPEFAYEFLDIRGLSDEEIRGKAEVRAALLIMRHIFGSRLAQRLPEILRLAAGGGKWKDSERRRSAIKELLWYTVKAARGLDSDREALARAVSEGLAMSGQERMLTLAEQWHNEGMQKGMVQTAREFVLANLRARFGDTPGEIEAALQGIESRDVLKRLHEYAMVAKDLEAFTAALREALETKSE